MMPLTQKFAIAATWSAIALGFAIPISTGASNLLFALTILLFVLSGDYREKLSAIARNPAALAVLLFCVAIGLGSAYGTGSATDKLHYLGKYLSLLLVPLLVPLFSSRSDRIRALVAICAAMLLTMALSYSIQFKWLSAEMLAMADSRAHESWEANSLVVFKLSITHGFLMAIYAFLLMLAAQYTTSARLRWVQVVLGALAVVNVFFMVKSRTGYLVLAVLGVYFFSCRFGRRGVTIAALGFALAGVAAYQWSDAFHERTHAAIAEASAWKLGKGDETSIGLRFDYYSNTLAIIKDHPWFGVGTGGFAAAYGEKVKDTAMASSNNPHNQYLLIAAQLGLAGLAALIWLYATYWRQAGRLEAPFRQMARGVLLAMLVGNLFNSFMLDYTERMFFAWISGVLLAELSAPRAEVSTG